MSIEVNKRLKQLNELNLWSNGGELFVLNQNRVGGCDVLTYFCSHFMVVKSVFLPHPSFNQVLDDLETSR